MKNVKQIDTESRTYYIFNDMINIKCFDSNLLKICRKSYKNTDIYYIGYIAMKDLDYVSINRVNPLYFVINKADGHNEEIYGNKYCIFASTDKSKDVLTK